MRLRAMAYNVHGFGTGTAEMAAAVAVEQPDVLLLNETGNLGFRLRRFARRVEMQWAAGTGFLRPVPNAVLVRSPWRLIRHEVVIFPRSRKTVRRGMVVAVAGRAGQRLGLAALHLGLSGRERVEQARLLTDLLAGRQPMILGGDLNEEPDAPAASWIRERYWDTAGEEANLTFPGLDPRARIDYLFVSEGIAVERAWVGGESFVRLSDHLPVLADLTIG
jgi:endonuclease/exonuclease/phosphatase family metal-dependent hydrolase